MSKIVLFWLHRCSCRREREASADRSQVYNRSVREKVGVKFISSSEEYGETRRVVFKQKEIE